MSKNEVVEKKEKTFDVVLSEKLDASANALPREFNKTRFVTNAMALLSEHPELKNYGSSQVMNGLLRGAKHKTATVPIIILSWRTALYATRMDWAIR